MSARHELVRVVRGADGLPVAGAELRFYQPGTSTPVAVYASMGAGSAADQPLVSDSDGRITAYLDPGYYKVVTTFGETTDTIEHYAAADPIPAGALVSAARNAAGELIARAFADGRAIFEADPVTDAATQFLPGGTFNVSPTNPRHRWIKVGDTSGGGALTQNCTVAVDRNAGWLPGDIVGIAKGDTSIRTVTVSGLDADGSGTATLKRHRDFILLICQSTDAEGLKFERGPLARPNPSTDDVTHDSGTLAEWIDAINTALASFPQSPALFTADTPGAVAAPGPPTGRVLTDSGAWAHLDPEGTPDPEWMPEDVTAAKVRVISQADFNSLTTEQQQDPDFLWVVQQPATLEISYLGGDGISATASSFVISGLSSASISAGDRLLICAGSKHSSGPLIDTAAASAMITLGTVELLETSVQGGGGSGDRRARVQILSIPVSAKSADGSFDLTLYYAGSADSWIHAADVYLIKGEFEVVGSDTDGAATTPMALQAVEESEITFAASDVLVVTTALVDSGSMTVPGAPLADNDHQASYGSTLDFFSGFVTDDADDVGDTYSFSYTESGNDNIAGAAVVLRRTA